MNLLTKKQVEKIASHFHRKKILVLGDIGIDKYTVGRVTRISPEAPIPIVEVQNTVLKLGLAANVAENISSLGGDVYVVGVIGKDSSATEFKSLFKKIGISSNQLVTDSSRKTTVKERVVAENQQIVRIDHETPKKIDSEILKEVWSKIEKIINDVDAIIIEDYAKGLIDVSISRQIMSAAEDKRIPVFVDPNLRSSISLYYGCTVLTPNTSEAEALSKIRIHDYESLYQAGYKILEDANCKTVIITRGKDGMAIFNRGDEKPVLIPTFAREVFDVSGAGDTTIAMLALSNISGADMVESALMANSAAGIVVGKRGTATTTSEEVAQYVDLLNKLAAKKAKKIKG